MRNILALALSLLLIPTLRAQFYNSGQEPLRIQWHQLETSHFRVVFPHGSKALAHKYLVSLQNMAATPTFSHHKLTRRLDVLLHTGTVRSNAWVAWAPARLEVLTTPPQDMYAHNWYNQLAVHELRHAVQIESINTGLTRFMSHLFGQQATGLALGLHIPLWLMEGDAIWSESVFSRAGRLRDPWFLMPLKTQWESGINFSYDKAYFGSFKDFTPDHYVLGSALVVAANQQFGNDAIHAAFSQAGRHFLWPGAFRQSLKKNTGLSPDAFYHSCRKGLSEKHLKHEPLPYGNEIYAAQTGENMVYLKQNFGENPMFVRKSGEKIHTLSEAGFYLDTPIDISPGHILFVRQVPHVRWQHRDHTEIIHINTNTGKQNSYRFSSRPVAPVLSPCGKWIVTTETREEGQQEVLFFDIEHETLVEKIQVPDLGFLTFPSWINNETLVFITTGDSGYAFITFQCKNKSWNRVTPFTRHIIRNLKAYGDTLFFAGELQEKGEIMAYDLRQNKTFRLTKSQFGADYPSYCKKTNTLTFSDYTLNGYKIRSLPASELSWEEVESFWNAGEIPFVEIPFQNVGNTYSADEINPRPYKGFTHLINIHSYGPVSVSPDEGTVKPGLTLMSQNLLNTHTFRGGYEYEFDKNGGRVFAEAEYAGFIPVIRASTYTGWYERKDNTGTMYQTRERETKMLIVLPLNISRGTFYRSLSLLSGFIWQNYNMQDMNTLQKYTSTLPRIDYGFLLSFKKITPVRNMFPKPGLVVRTTIRTTPFTNHRFGQQYAAETWFYLPGIGRHDGLSLYTGLEWHTDKPFASQIIRTPKGYNELQNRPADGFVSYGITWRTPLAYPDWSLPGLVYLKRIYGGLFYDQLTGIDLNANSVGLELYGDYHIFRLPTPANMGLRYSYLMREKKFNVEVFASLSFNF